MTADDFLNKHFQEPDDLVNGQFRKIFKKKLIEFATHHVELALKSASKGIIKIEYYGGNKVEFYSFNEKTVINAYSIDNIK